jgi:hypothetical protein
VCAWLDNAFKQDTAATVAAVKFMRQVLTRNLDVLIRSGVPQARHLEDRLVDPAPQQNTA